jgi:hypothetical protein
MSQCGNTGKLCRDEDCDRIELHLEHEVEPKEPEKEQPSRSATAPWKRSSPKGLDRSIAKATSQLYALPFEAILRHVENDYGTCIPRTVQRHLRTLVDRGHLLRIDLGRRLHGYLRPGSNMVNDLDLMREQIEAMSTV